MKNKATKKTLKLFVIVSCDLQHGDITIWHTHAASVAGAKKNFFAASALDDMFTSFDDMVASDCETSYKVEEVKFSK